MTTQDGPNNDRRPSAFAIWFTHRAALMWLVGGVLYVLGDTVQLTALALGCDSAALVAVVATLIATSRHARGLCWRCAADIPADGPRRVEQYARLLRLRHRIHVHPARLLWVPAAFVTLVSAEVLWLLGMDPLIALVVMYGVIAGLFWLNDVHRPLAWWCPLCRWDDGIWRTRPAPEPVPTVGPE